MLREQIISVLAEIEASIDFQDEDIDPKDKLKLVIDTENLMTDIGQLVDSYKGGRIIKEGYKIAIAGHPNAGKSSLFNLLLQQQRALVTPTPGTTRDYLSEWIDLEGYKVNIVDTAGLRKKGGKIEKAGQKAARDEIKSADLVIWMIDLTQKNWSNNITLDHGNTRNILLGNKIDIVTATVKTTELAKKHKIPVISCKTKKGIKDLKNLIIKRINEKMPDLTSGVVVTSARHKQKLAETIKYVKLALRMIKNNESPELTAFNLRSAINAIDEITGKIYNEEILGKIFSKFCIGK